LGLTFRQQDEPTDSSHGVMRKNALHVKLSGEIFYVSYMIAQCTYYDDSFLLRPAELCASQTVYIMESVD